MHIDNVIFLILSKNAYTKFSEGPDYMVKCFQCKNCVGSSPKTKKCVASFLVPGDRESPETLGFRAFYFLHLYSAKMYDKALLITVFVDFRKNFI